MENGAHAVLIVEDDDAVGLVLAGILKQAGYQARHVARPTEALELLEAHPYDAVLSDVKMPEMDGVTLLRAIVERWPDLPVVLLTADGSVPLAVEAMKAGASDFLLKPFDRDEIVFVIKKVISSVPNEIPEVPLRSGNMLGDSAGMKNVFATIQKVARSTATVLIRGETGTGKELVARALHELSPRSDGAFVRVHCGALPDTLLESELFGYEKGAFTGAVARKPGRVELAHGGTLFLDEIGDITAAIQLKLLRVIQEREFERVGGTQTIKVDVRIVAATHRDLEKMVADGSFREDLFYRLNVVPIEVPPLRERGDDVEVLARHFADSLGKQHGVGNIKLAPDAIGIFRTYLWPGNVRQLQNLIERLVVLADSPVISGTDVATQLKIAPLPARPAPGSAPAPASSSDAASLEANRRQAERDALTQALARARNNRTLAARLLQVSRRTLYNKLREYGLE